MYILLYSIASQIVLNGLLCLLFIWEQENTGVIASMSNKHVNGLKTSRTGNDVYVSFRTAKCRDKKNQDQQTERKTKQRNLKTKWILERTVNTPKAVSPFLTKSYRTFFSSIHNMYMHL